jgi:DNA polymerase-1
VDTFILSQVYNPNYPRPKGMKAKGGKIAGPHSLEAWGLRLNYPKSEFDDFSKFTPEMLKYCQRDVMLTGLLYIKLTERMRQVGFSEEGVELEHQAWNIIQNKQKRNGFPFNKRKAEELYAEIRHREEQLRDEIYRLWPPRLTLIKTVQNAIKKNGEKSVNYQTAIERYPEVRLLDGNRADVYDYVAFNLGSPPQRIEKLLELGWKPVKFTKKTKKGGGGNPQIDEDSLLAFAESSGRTEVLALAKWIVFNSRANMIQTWLNAYNEDTGAIHGSLFIASTLRYKHSNPNSANIPAVRMKKDADGDEHAVYGEEGSWTYEARDLWDCGDPDEFVLVGIDGTGIQNRCLIHSLIKTVGEDAVRPFMELSLRGDIHKHNIEVLGLANKAAAKKFYYSLMMGGGGALLASDQAQFGTHMTAKEGEAKKTALISSIPGFYRLIEALQSELSSYGRITLCDGTPILVPSPHMVIPYLLQGDESRLMKRAMVYMDQEIRKARLQNDVYKVADIHDEHQWKVRKEYAEQFVAMALPCFPRAGESFGYRIRIDGDAKIGLSWAKTH